MTLEERDKIVSKILDYIDKETKFLPSDQYIAILEDIVVNLQPVIDIVKE